MAFRVAVAVLFLFALTRCVDGGSSHLVEVVRPLRRFHARLSHSVRRLSPRHRSRSLLQVSECEWNDADSVCEGTLAASIPILSESDNEIAQFLATTFQCFIETDEDSCNDVGFCFWNSAAVECTYLDFAASNPESPCVQNAPATLDLFEAIEVCPVETTEEECEATDACLWDPATSTCEEDAFRVFLGFSRDELTQEILPLLEDQAIAGFNAFEEEFDTSDPGFDWTDVLEFDVPAIDCPEGTDARFCDYADAFTRGSLPTILYCDGQYSDLAEECTSDPLCEIDTDDGSCTGAESVFVMADADGILVLVDSVPNETDRDIFAARVACEDADEITCADAHELCVWNSIESTCDLSITGLFQALVDSGDDPSDGVCAFFSYFAEAGCESIFDETTCLENQQCEFDEDGCSTSAGFLLETIFSEEPELEDELSAIGERCSELLTQDECEA